MKEGIKRLVWFMRSCPLRSSMTACFIESGLRTLAHPMNRFLHDLNDALQGVENVLQGGN